MVSFRASLTRTFRVRSSLRAAARPAAGRHCAPVIVAPVGKLKGTEPKWLVICRHALRNAALPVVTVIGVQLGLLLGGAVLTETVFAVPGLGRLIVRAIVQLDFPIVQAGVFLIAMIIVAANFVVDVLYVYLNPTIRLR